MMNTKMFRWIAAAGVSVAMTLSGIGAETGTNVPRSEYEQLKQEMQALQAKMDQLAAREAAVEKKQTETPAPSKTEVTNQSAQNKNLGLYWEPSVIQPGWERIRAPGWMEPGRFDQQNARIAQGKDFQLFMGLQTAGRFQWFNQSNVYKGGVWQGNLTPGFQTAWGSIDFLAEINPNFEVYFDMYLSSMPHQDHPQGHEGYMLIRGLGGPLGQNPVVQSIFDNINLRAGQFDIDFGDAQYRRTDDARGQPNALVGNAVFDPSSTEIGVEVMSKPQKYNWLVGVGSGSEEGSFEPGRGMSVHAKVWANLNALRLSVSAYHLHHALDTSSFTNFFRANRSGGQYQGILGGGSAPGQILVGSGKQVSAFQGDVSYIKKGYEFYGNLGWVRATPSYGNEEWVYYTAEGIYRFSPRFYAAARYSGGLNRELRGVSDNGFVSRYQFGGGYWLSKTILFKMEYMYQNYKGFKHANGSVSGIDAWRDPSINGLISEITFSY